MGGRTVNDKPEDMSQEAPNYGDNPLEYFAGLREALSFAAEMFRDLLTSVAREIVEWYNTYYVVIDSDAPKRKHTGRLRSARELRDIRRQGDRVYMRDRRSGKSSAYAPPRSMLP
jgi:hypothetical protein